MGVNLATAPRKQRRHIHRRIALIYQQFYLARRLSVLENVLCGRLGLTSRWRSLLGRFTKEDRRVAWSAICEVGLQEQVHQRADTLSGGEQKMLEVDRALLLAPELILVDEPSMGLAPKVTAHLFETLVELRQAGVTVLMVEQNARSALAISDDGIVLEQGRLALAGSADEILSDGRVGALFLGGGLASRKSPPP